MASDSVTRAPESVESRGSAETTKPPESALPPTSDLVLPYQSRAADRERTSAKGDQTVDRTGENATEPDTDSERSAGTDRANRQSESVHADEGSADHDQMTLADLRSTHRELIAGLDRQGPGAQHSMIEVASPDVVRDARDQASSHDVASDPGIQAGTLAPQIGVRSDVDATTSHADPPLDSEHRRTASDPPDQRQHVQDDTPEQNDVADDEVSIRRKDGITNDEAVPSDQTLGSHSENGSDEAPMQHANDGSPAATSHSPDHDSNLDRSKPHSAGQVDIENAPTIQIWAHRDPGRVDGAFGQYLIQHPASTRSVETETSADSDSIADSNGPDFEIPANEQILRAKTVDSYSPLSHAANANDVFEANFDDGSKGVYKPAQGEAFGLRIDVPHGELWKREIAASRLDDLLGFDLVPTTTDWDGHKGVGSMQEWAERSNPGRRPVATYDDREVERMAVFDYVIGNTDRHRNNYLTDPDGHIVAIDHGCSFPEGDIDPIRSDFVAEKFRKPISDETLEAVRRVDPSELSAVLKSAGLNEVAAAGAEDRVKEIQDNGAITGQSWTGMITDARWKSVK